MVAQPPRALLPSTSSCNNRGIIIGVILFVIGIIVGSLGGVARLGGGGGLSEETINAASKQIQREVFVHEDDRGTKSSRDQQQQQLEASKEPAIVKNEPEEDDSNEKDKAKLQPVGDRANDKSPMAKNEQQQQKSTRDPNVYPFNPSFDASSPIYISQNVNVSYHAGRVVIPFQFRTAYPKRAEGLNGDLEEDRATRLSKKIPVDPHLHIHEGRETAKEFIDLWRTFGRGADFPKIPYSKFGSPFWIENVRKKLRIHLPEVKVRPLLGQIIHREGQNKRLIKEAKDKGVAAPDLQYPLLPEGHRRLMLDVGARQFSGSPLWLGKHYPEAKTFDFVAFELLDLEKDYGPAKNYFKSVQYIQKAGWMHDRGVRIEGVRMAKVVDSGGGGPDVAQKDIDANKGVAGDGGGLKKEGDGEEAPTPPPTRAGVTYWNAPSVDLAAFIKNNSRPDDFVVMKLDIEGGEWQLIQHLVNEGVIPYYIDEIMMECHAKDPNTYAILGFKLLPPECMDLIADLREMGVYAHRWV